MPSFEGVKALQDHEEFMLYRGWNWEGYKERWTDGRTWEVEKGEDFECTLNSFRNGLYSIAKTLAMKVTSMTLPDEGVIRFRFVDVDGLDEGEDFPDDT